MPVFIVAINGFNYRQASKNVPPNGIEKPELQGKLYKLVARLKVVAHEKKKIKRKEVRTQ